MEWTLLAQSSQLRISCSSQQVCAGWVIFSPFCDKQNRNLGEMTYLTSSTSRNPSSKAENKVIRGRDWGSNNSNSDMQVLGHYSKLAKILCYMIFFFFLTFAAAESLQSCPTLCDPIDGSPPGSPVPGILQARTLEWVAISFSNAWWWKVKVKSLSRVRLITTPWTAAYQAPPSMGFSRQE